MTCSRVVLVSYHYLESKRKAGFHWLADAYEREGWDVVFVTASVSWISWLRRDPRLVYPLLAERRTLKYVRERVTSYVLFTTIHPFSLRSATLDRLTRPAFSRYGQGSPGPVEELLHGADLIVFESAPGILWLDRFRAASPSARVVYRVSDDLSLLGLHPLVVEAERRLAESADLVSVPSPRLLARFESSHNAVVHSHGIATEFFDRPVENPYAEGVNVVFVGSSHFDARLVTAAAESFPDWRFHVIGPVRLENGRSNVVRYGELPFEATVPYIRHADIGLQALTYKPGAEYLADSSLKMQQYVYCGLPVVAPSFLRSRHENVVYYEPDDPASVRKALEEARGRGRTASHGNVVSWTELARTLAGE